MIANSRANTLEHGTRFFSRTRPVLADLTPSALRTACMMPS